MKKLNCSVAANAVVSDLPLAFECGRRAGWRFAGLRRHGLAPAIGALFISGVLAALLCWPIVLQAEDPPATPREAKGTAAPAEATRSKDSRSESATALEVPRAPKPGTAKPKELPGAFRKDVPSSLEDLKAMERHVKKLSARVAPAVVAVEVGSGSGSGVVISEDGVVLCAAHVCGTTNRPVVFTFSNGKTARGKTLGTNHNLDAGLMKITDPGPWPHAEVGELDASNLGDWVLALGHPGGFDPERSVVVRLGRIIRMAPFAVQTDCTLIGGDSGGPLFDMYGRVVAIHSRISESTAENFHVPIGAYQESWERLAKSEDWGGRRPTPWVGVWGKDHAEGFRVELVNKRGPGEKAGVKVGDVVMKVNDQTVKDYQAFAISVARAKTNDELTLEIKRGDEMMSFKVTVQPRPAELSLNP